MLYDALVERAARARAARAAVLRRQARRPPLDRSGRHPPPDDPRRAARRARRAPQVRRPVRARPRRRRGARARGRRRRRTRSCPACRRRSPRLRSPASRSRIAGSPPASPSLSGHAERRTAARSTRSRPAALTLVVLMGLRPRARDRRAAGRARLDRRHAGRDRPRRVARRAPRAGSARSRALAPPTILIGSSSAPGMSRHRRGRRSGGRAPSRLVNEHAV